MKENSLNHPFIKNPAEALRDILLERKNKNTGYSVRAFSRDIGLSPAFVSQILNGKRNLSLQQTIELADRLNISLEDTQLANSTPTSSSKKLQKQFELLQSTIEHEKIIRYWYHFAILELCQVKGASAKTSWVSERLGISELEAQTAIQRLVSFGYLEVTPSQKLKRTGMPIVFNVKGTNLNIRAKHRNRLEASIRELEQTNLEDVNSRVFQTIFVATSRKRVESAKQMMIDFSHKLMKHLTEGPQEEVFQFSSQLFSAENNKTKPNPITKKETL